MPVGRPRKYPVEGNPAETEQPTVANIDMGAPEGDKPVAVEVSPEPPKEPEKPKPHELNDIEMIQAERELRRYIRKDGGFRTGIPPRDLARAKGLMKILKREEPVWDRTLDPPARKDLTS